MRDLTYRDIIIRDLSQINNWRFSVMQAAEELETINAEFTAIKATSYDKMPGGSGHNTQEEKLVTAIAKREQRSAELEMNKRKLADIERLLKKLTKDERNVIERMVVNGEKAESIAQELGYDVRHVYNKRNSALIHLCQLRYGAAYRP